MRKTNGEKKAGLRELVRLMERLRGPGGCPWDKAQTPESLTPYIIEEAYELVEAIREGDAAHVCEELGDLLFQIVFQAQLAGEEGKFTMADVTAAIHAKMIQRHPHVFGTVKVENAEEVRKNWVRLKEEERGAPAECGSALGKVPRGLPSLLRARRLTENAAEAGFDWEKTEEVAQKLEEEWQELKACMTMGPADRIEDEFGDVLFVLVNLSRFLKVDPEQALGRAIDKFIRRFTYLEEEVKKSGRELHALSLPEMDKYWNEAKNKGM